MLLFREGLATGRSIDRTDTLLRTARRCLQREHASVFLTRHVGIAGALRKPILTNPAAGRPELGRL
jgi:hypothetical protein